MQLQTWRDWQRQLAPVIDSPRNPLVPRCCQEQGRGVLWAFPSVLGPSYTRSHFNSGWTPGSGEMEMSCGVSHLLSWYIWVHMQIWTISETCSVFHLPLLSWPDSSPKVRWLQILSLWTALAYLKCSYKKVYTSYTVPALWHFPRDPTQGHV